MSKIKENSEKISKQGLYKLKESLNNILKQIKQF